MKVACYGKDQRPGKTLYGDCVHPCNARPGCEYQSGILNKLNILRKALLVMAEHRKNTSVSKYKFILKVATKKYFM